MRRHAPPTPPRPGDIPDDFSECGDDYVDDALAADPRRRWMRALVALLVYFFARAKAIAARVFAPRVEACRAPAAPRSGDAEDAEAVAARDAVWACTHLSGGSATTGAGIEWHSLLEFRHGATAQRAKDALWADAAFYRDFLAASGDLEVKSEAWRDGARTFSLRHPLGVPVPRWVGVAAVPRLRGHASARVGGSARLSAFRSRR